MKKDIKIIETSSGRYELMVNGYNIGNYICGKDKKYLNPEKRADEQLKKTHKMLDRNIKRLEKELKGMYKMRIELE